MQIRKTLAVLFALLLYAIASAQDSPAVAGSVDEQAVRDAREALIAAGKGRDRAAYERLLAPGFTFTHATGAHEDRRQYIDHAMAGTQGFQTGRFERIDEQLRVLDTTAVWSSRSILHGRTATSELRSLNVYVKSGDAWLWAAGQSTRLPTRPQPFPVAVAVRDAHAGRYVIDASRTLDVRVRDDALHATLPPFLPAELIAESEHTFRWFHPELNVYSQLVFGTDADGRATATFRREGEQAWVGRRE